MESPCNQICVMSISLPYCVGCGRTLLEIEEWSSASEQQQAEIIAELPDRMARLHSVSQTEG